MTRAKDISKIVTDADLSGTLEVTKGASGASANAAADELVLQNSGDAGLSILSPNANNSQILLGSPVAVAGGIIRWTGDDNAVKIGTNNTGSTLRFHVSGFSEVMRISSGGNVGIGTTSPSPASGSDTTLEIAGSTGPSLTINDTGQAEKYSLLANADDLKIYYGSTPMVSFQNDGKVGIGTSSPSTPLHVTDSNPRIRLEDSDASSHSEIQSNGQGDLILKADPDNNGSSTQISFETDGTEAMRISGGNVGIGTSSPSSFNSNASNLVVGSGSGGEGMTIYSGSTDNGAIFFADGTSGASETMGGISYNHNDDSLNLRVNNDPKVYVTSSGNVGIGTSSPATLLNLSATNPVLRLNGSTSGNCEIQTDGVSFLINADSGNTASGSNIAFRVDNTEAMRIDGSGIVNINCTTQQIVTNERLRLVGKAAFTTSGDAALNLNRDSDDGGTLRFHRGTTQVGDISVTASSTSYNTSSDHRLKENVVAMADATTRLKQLQPKRFNFIADADTTVDGFLAHEVQSVVPEAITGTHNEVDADGNPVYQGIDQSKLVPLLVKTIQELEARITALENGE